MPESDQSDLCNTHFIPENW